MKWQRVWNLKFIDQKYLKSIVNSPWVYLHSLNWGYTLITALQNLKKYIIFIKIEKWHCKNIIFKQLHKNVSVKNEQKNFLCLLKLDSLIKKFTSIYNTACDKLIMHFTNEAIILQHHQIQSSKWAREENGCSFAAIF